MKQRIKIRGNGSIEKKKLKSGDIVFYIRFKIPNENGVGTHWSENYVYRDSRYIEDAREYALEIKKQLEDELNNDFARIFLVDYIDAFHEERKKRTITPENPNGEFSPQTISRDEIKIRRLKEIFPPDLLLVDVDKADIEKAYNELEKQGLSYDALKKTHAKLQQILQHAIDIDNAITFNPCKRIERFKSATSVYKETRRSLTEEQAIQLAEDLVNSPKDGKIVAVWLALATGMRRGESLGLVWKNVDIDNKVVYIRQQLNKLGEIHIPKGKKTRHMALDDGTIQFLLDWKAYQSKLFFQGNDVPDDFPVCTNEIGDFQSVDRFDKWRRQFFVEHGLAKYTQMETYVDKQGIKHYRFSGYDGFKLHELRHTQATLLVGSNEVDLYTIKDRLGHSHISTTMGYTHSITENERKAADVMLPITKAALKPKQELVSA